MNKARALALAKVMAAIAWADEQLQAHEMNHIKGLVHEHFSREQFTGKDWCQIDCYFLAPVGSQERQRLTAELIRHLPTQRSINQAWEHLQQMADEAGEAHNQALHEVHEAIAQGRSWWWPSWFPRASVPGPNREHLMDDYFNHELAFACVCTLWAKDLPVPEDVTPLRRGGAVCGVLLRVASSDQQFREAESTAVHTILAEAYQLESTHAQIIIEAAQRRGARIDLQKCTRHLRQACNRSQRQTLLSQCFAVANADDHTSAEEIAAIRSLTLDLGLDHEDFIAAKLTIPKQQRAAHH
ncbi:MAG: TerB family tellurite resistance protein [Planctomycetota bacterium]|nr:MAG: TerB family tellurite resistance protein [Planctomycetota bacterium]